MEVPIPMPPLRDLIKLYEDVATMSGSFPAAKVRAVAVNTGHLNAEDAGKAIQLIEDETGLPACDAVRDSAERLVDALLG